MNVRGFNRKGIVAVRLLIFGIQTHAWMVAGCASSAGRSGAADPVRDSSHEAQKCFQRGQYDLTVALCSEVIDKSTNETTTLWAHWYRGYAHYKRGEYAEALLDLDIVGKDDQSLPPDRNPWKYGIEFPYDLHYVRGMALQMLGRSRDADDVYKTFLKQAEILAQIDPDGPTTLPDSGGTYRATWNIHYTGEAYTRQSRLREAYKQAKAYVGTSVR